MRRGWREDFEEELGEEGSPTGGEPVTPGPGDPTAIAPSPAPPISGPEGAARRGAGPPHLGHAPSRISQPIRRTGTMATGPMRNSSNRKLSDGVGTVTGVLG
ncbi:hypothetical protein SKAU_G00425190 [Synaphobranchus kaupii]|uniref:Uncharacterized protein n=1 Tax=Synaphobranchus kaupii TaxID=118154 RepID=A0A9Q1I9Y0_SYNKA|nr:hypothetical protein SKAU_G00425190 [Synaphobranchus kaupii]